MCFGIEHGNTSFLGTQWKCNKQTDDLIHRSMDTPIKSSWVQRLVIVPIEISTRTTWLHSMEDIWIKRVYLQNLHLLN